MDPISKFARTLAVLRKNSPSRKATGSPAQPDHAAIGAGQPPPEATAQRLRADIAKRLRAIDRDDPNRQHAAVRVFIERVLLHELGSELQRSPKFHGIVDDVQRAMQSDEGVKAELQELITELGSA